MLAQVLTSDKKTRRNLNQRLLDAGHNLVTYYKVMRIYVNEDIRGDTLKILRLFFADATDAQIAHSFDEALNAARLDDSGFLQYSLFRVIAKSEAIQYEVSEVLLGFSLTLAMTYFYRDRKINIKIFVSIYFIGLLEFSPLLPLGSIHIHHDTSLSQG